MDKCIDSTVTVTNPDGTRTTTTTRTVETTGDSVRDAFGGFTAGSTPDETGPYAGVDEIPTPEKVILSTVLEGVEILSKGAEYVRRVSKIAGLFLAKKD